mmetsp:Transcript_20457/g.40570  ORF Transcript_20457/g.40570 Transcript_20457/m.40570 type:complete len:80 (+) Transcript_20457:432-671(+)
MLSSNRGRRLPRPIDHRAIDSNDLTCTHPCHQNYHNDTNNTSTFFRTRASGIVEANHAQSFGSIWLLVVFDFLLDKSTS